jgi:hypothetical protein
MATAWAAVANQLESETDRGLVAGQPPAPQPVTSTFCTSCGTGMPPAVLEPGARHECAACSLKRDVLADPTGRA